MNEGQVFQRGIFEDPDDDAPRLTFADWLDDKGDGDRAAFIRFQVRHHRMALEGVVVKAVAERAMRKLERKNRRQWIDQDVQWLMREAGNTEQAQGQVRSSILLAQQQFRRGFLDAITLEARMLWVLPRNAGISIPWLRVVDPEGFAFPDGEYFHMVLEQIARMRPRRLNLSGNALTDSAAGRLSQLLGEQIEEFDLSDNELENPDFAGLAAGSYVNRLRKLILRRNNIAWAYGTQLPLPTSRSFPALENIDLSGNQLDNENTDDEPEFPESITGTRIERHFPKLQTLDCSHQGRRDPGRDGQFREYNHVSNGAVDLVSSTNVPASLTIDIRQNAEDEVLFETFQQNGCLEKYKLDVIESKTRVINVQMPSRLISLAHSPCLGDKSFLLKGCTYGQVEAMRYLLQSPAAQNLRGFIGTPAVHIADAARGIEGVQISVLNFERVGNHEQSARAMPELLAMPIARDLRRLVSCNASCLTPDDILALQSLREFNLEKCANWGSQELVTLFSHPELRDVDFTGKITFTSFEGIPAMHGSGPLESLDIANCSHMQKADISHLLACMPRSLLNLQWGSLDKAGARQVFREIPRELPQLVSLGLNTIWDSNKALLLDPSLLLSCPEQIQTFHCPDNFRGHPWMAEALHELGKKRKGNPLVIHVSRKDGETSAELQKAAGRNILVSPDVEQAQKFLARKKRAA